jgi:dienelactone hydrolase
MDKQIVIEASAGTFHAYISRPAKSPAPAVIVLQEALTPTSEQPAMSWQHRASSRSRRTYSGGNSLGSIST